MAKRGDKQYKKEFQYKELLFNLNNKESSLTLSKAKGKLLEQFKRAEI